MRRPLYFFALFLVLYELATYLTNDMILPGMMQVITEYHAGQNYVALSMGYYLLGNCATLLFVGILSEHFGKQRIILFGNAFFLLCMLFIMLSPNIHIFMLWRFFSGMGLSVISLAYALIHEYFDDRSAVKLTALMGNITVLAPLAGPALGSMIVYFFSWRYIFGLTAIMATLSFWGLLKYTPGSGVSQSQSTPSTLSAYQTILRHPEFLRGTLLAIFLMLPLFIWISQAPNLILYKLKQNYFHYGVYQVISLSGLALSSIVMQFIAGKFSISQLIKVGVYLVITGVIISLFGFRHIHFVIVGMFIYNLGLGLANGCVTRLVMTLKGLPSGMVATLFGFIEMVFLIIGIVLTNKIAHHYNYNLLSFTASICFCGISAVLLARPYLALQRTRAWE